MRTFSTGATRDSDESKFDYEGFLSPHALKLFAAYMHKHRQQADGSVRDSANWQKGMPRAQYMKSAWRHFHEVWTLHRDYLDRVADGEVNAPAFDNPELVEAMCALFFNVQGYLHEYAIGRDVGGVAEGPEPLKLVKTKWQHYHSETRSWNDVGTPECVLSPEYVDSGPGLPENFRKVSA